MSPLTLADVPEGLPAPVVCGRIESEGERLSGDMSRVARDAPAAIIARTLTGTTILLRTVYANSLTIYWDSMPRPALNFSCA